MAWGKHIWDNNPDDMPDNGDMSDDYDDGGGSPAVKQASTRRSREEAGLKTPTSAQAMRPPLVVSHSPACSESE